MIFFFLYIQIIRTQIKENQENHVWYYWNYGNTYES